MKARQKTAVREVRGMLLIPVAPFTVLTFPVDDVDLAVEELVRVALVLDWQFGSARNLNA